MKIFSISSLVLVAKKINLIFFANIKHKGIYRILILCYLATIVFTFILANKHLIEKRKYDYDMLEIQHYYMTNSIVNEIPKKWITYKCNTAIDEAYPNNILDYFPWIEKFTNSKLRIWSERYLFEDIARSTSWKYVKANKLTTDTKIDNLRNEIKNSNLKYKRSCDQFLIEINSSSKMLNEGINRLYHPFSSYFLYPYITSSVEYKLINLLWVLVYPLAFFMIIVQILSWIVRGFIKKNK